MKKLYVGAAYYPELWDESEVGKDVERCKKLGVNVLRIGEFAWSSMEPEEGKFTLGWLKDIVKKLYENGIYTVMCTPTCTPPRWLAGKYEETRMVTNNLVRADISSRCHPCKTSKIMREKNRLIVTELAKAFQGDKGVIGWQIDNEMFPYGDGCFCPLCKAEFRRRLKEKYKDINSLNRAWGMKRWSLDYNSFDEIEPPYPAQWRHPSLRKAWWDFQCGQIKSYIDEQAEIIHKYSDAPVGTDMMSHNFLSYYDINEKLDVVQFNHYNTAEDLPRTSFFYDFLRPIKDRPFWVTETQVGWNGSEFAESGFRPVGNCYINTWLPVALGADTNMYWLFRAHQAGHEIGHGALFSAAGREYRVTGEVADAIKDFEKCEDILSKSAIKSDIAIHFSSNAQNSFACAPLIKNFDYGDTLTDKFHKAFVHYNVDVIDAGHSLDGYKVVISPFLSTVDICGLKERITEWVKGGGTWIVGPMSDIMDENVSKYVNAPYSFLEEFAGVYTKYQKPIANDVFKAKWKDGSECGVSVCYDAYELKGAKSLADYDGGEFANLCAVAERQVGKGKVILLGSVVSLRDLKKLVRLNPIAEASDNVSLIKRTGERNAVIAVETENKEGFVALDGEYREILSGAKVSGKVKIKPYGVLVLEK